MLASGVTVVPTPLRLAMHNVSEATMRALPYTVGLLEAPMHNRLRAPQQGFELSAGKRLCSNCFCVSPLTQKTQVGLLFLCQVEVYW